METAIWLYEARRARDRFDLLRFDASGSVSSGMFEEEWPRYVLRMAMGAGKTKGPGSLRSRLVITAAQASVQLSGRPSVVDRIRRRSRTPFVSPNPDSLPSGCGHRRCLAPRRRPGRAPIPG